MKTRTFVISKTKVDEVKHAIERDCDAEIWVHLCDGFVRVQVDNVEHKNPYNLVTVESPYKERPAGDGLFDAFYFRPVQVPSDWWLNVDGAVKIQAVAHHCMKEYGKKNEIIVKARQMEGAKQ